MQKQKRDFLVHRHLAQDHEQATYKITVNLKS